MISHEILHKRICDHEEDATNTQTYHEFIRESEEELGLDPRDLLTITDEQLQEYVEWLDYLWTK